MNPFPSENQTGGPRADRRDFLRSAILTGAGLALASSAQADPLAQAPIPTKKSNHRRNTAEEDAKKLPGAQRLSVPALQQWEALKFGMFIHFGMSTFLDSELPGGSEPSTAYAPDKLDVDQWVAVARDAGMKYAVLTTKHVAGHSLWPTKHNDYHVGTSGNQTDVVAAFVKACERRGVKPGFYYCAWDNHNRFGSVTPNLAPLPPGRNGPPTGRNFAYVTQAYLDFQWAQITELMENYGPITEWWLDIPMLLPRDYRNRLYAHIAGRQPETVIICNNGIGDGSEYQPDRSWPTDAITIERFLPNSMTGHVKWRNIDGQNYYLPGEVCDPIGAEWFYSEFDQPRSDAELLGMYLTTVSRGANLLLDVAPDKHGLIPDRYAGALQRLRKNLDAVGM